MHKGKAIISLRVTLNVRQTEKPGKDVHEMLVRPIKRQNVTEESEQEEKSTAVKPLETLTKKQGDQTFVFLK